MKTSNQAAVGHLSSVLPLQLNKVFRTLHFHSRIWSSSTPYIYALNCIDVVGNKVEKLCDLCSITLNKNAVFGDSSALSPGGVRIG